METFNEEEKTPLGVKWCEHSIIDKCDCCYTYNGWAYCPINKKTFYVERYLDFDDKGIVPSTPVNHLQSYYK